MSEDFPKVHDSGENNNIVVDKETEEAEELSKRKKSLEAHLYEDHASGMARKIKGVIFGGLDGTITTFAIIAASFGATMEFKQVIIMGIANLIADGFSMGFGDFVSGLLDRKYILEEKAKESQEINKNPAEEQEEMVTLYRLQGLAKDDAEKIVSVLFSKPEQHDFMLSAMLRMELELDDEEELDELVQNGLVMFSSFVFFGAMPVLGLFLGNLLYGQDQNPTGTLVVTCILSLITLFLVGGAGGQICKMSILESGSLTLLNGVIAGSVSQFLGYGIEVLLK